MRRMAVLSLLLMTACATAQEPAATTAPAPSTSAGPAATSTVPEPGSSTVPEPGSSTTSDAGTTTTLSALRSLAYEQVAELPFPVQMDARPGDDVAYVITKNGFVWSFAGGSVNRTPVMDISDQVTNQGEQGLLSIALHPTAPDRFFLHYSALDGDTVVSEFTFDSRLAADPASERVILRLDQPAGNHNGGMLQFHEGTLYLGLGDGGGAGDQFGNGQNLDTLLGGLVALDVDGAAEPSLYMYGLRNPWRFWIDGDTLYVADVGQNTYEEITVTDMVPGQNLGWPIMEGLHCFRPSSGCDETGLVLPAVEITHGDSGTCSITGGVVYRGSAIPELAGTYLYSDFCGGYLRSLRWDGSVTAQDDFSDQVGFSGQVVGFGVDGEREVYVMTTSRVLKLVPAR